MINSLLSFSLSFYLLDGQRQTLSQAPLVAHMCVTLWKLSQRPQLQHYQGNRAVEGEVA